MWLGAKAVAFVAPLAGLAAAARCRPDLCSRVVEHPKFPVELVGHRADCHSFFSVTVVPATPTHTVTVSDTASSVTDTWTTLSATVTSSITIVVSSTETEIASFTVTSHTIATSTTTTTTTPISTYTPPARRRSAAPDPGVSAASSAADGGPVTITATRLPPYAREVCTGTSQYSSACSQLGVQHHTTTLRTPRAITVTVTASVTATDSVSVTSTTTVDVSTTTTDTITWSSEVSTTLIITSSTTTTTTIIASNPSVVPWCTNNGVVRGAGCHQSEYTTYCGTRFSINGQNSVVFNAPQYTFQDCLGICDSNGFCTAGTFDASTGDCTLYLYSGGLAYNSAPADVQSFTFIFGTDLNYNCPENYECPYDNSPPQCCNSDGCPYLSPPY